MQVGSRSFALAGEIGVEYSYYVEEFCHGYINTAPFMQLRAFEEKSEKWAKKC